jgi:iron complex transport system substrate-binding protein
LRTGPSRPLLVAAIVALTTSIASCRSPSPASGQAKRVVSLSPSTTEALAAIGATGLLVGRSRYCDYPPEVTKLPIVGGYTDPSYEAILALAPDLVTGARGPAGIGVVDRLAAQGIATYFPRTESFAGIDEMLRGLGARTGHAREADEVVKRLDADEDAVTRAVAALPKVRVLVLFGLQPIVAAGPGGFADEMVKRAGGDDVVTEGGAYPTLGMERVLALDPDVVLDAAWGEDEGKARLSTESPGWKELRAVKAGRVVTLRDEVVLRPGPRIAEGLRRVAKAIHPEVVLP